MMSSMQSDLKMKPQFDAKMTKSAEKKNKSKSIEMPPNVTVEEVNLKETGQNSKETDSDQKKAKSDFEQEKEDDRASIGTQTSRDAKQKKPSKTLRSP